jgi:hypothetical protein
MAKEPCARLAGVRRPVPQADSHAPMLTHRSLLANYPRRIQAE